MAMKGLDLVNKNLTDQINKVKGRNIAGLLAGGLIVQREAQARVSVEYGKLRASAFTRQAGPMKVEVGFSAEYAVHVHENLEQKLYGQPRRSGLGVYWGPNGGPRFLAAALRVRAQDVVRAVIAYARGGTK